MAKEELKLLTYTIPANRENYPLRTNVVFLLSSLPARKFKLSVWNNDFPFHKQCPYFMPIDQSACQFINRYRSLFPSLQIMKLNMVK